MKKTKFLNKSVTVMSLGLVFCLSACGSSSLSIAEGLTLITNIRDYQSTEEFTAPTHLTVSYYYESVNGKPTVTQPTISKVTRNYVLDIPHAYWYSYENTVNTFITTGPDNQDVKDIQTTTVKQWTYVNNSTLYKVNDVDKTYTATAYDAETDTSFADALSSLSAYYLGTNVYKLLISYPDATPPSTGFLDEAYAATKKSAKIKTEGDGSFDIDLTFVNELSSGTLNYKLTAVYLSYLLNSYYYYTINPNRYDKTRFSTSYEVEKTYPNLSDYTLSE